MKDSLDKDSIGLEHSHTPSAIKERIKEGHQHSYLRDFVYGAIDGTVTTFAIISGVAGAGLSVAVIFVLGLANLIADGFSMGVSNFLATRSDLQLKKKIYEMEKNHIEVVPEGEREEVRQILREKGFQGNLLEESVQVITADQNRWIDFMLLEEFGYSRTRISPLKAGGVTFGAFILVGAIPLLAFVYQLFNLNLQTSPFFISAIMTGVTFFLIGAFKSRFVIQHWFWSGLETLVLGSGAAGLAFFIGYALKQFLGG